MTWPLAWRIARKARAERARLAHALEQAHERCRHLAQHDARTGMLNREGLFTRLERAISDAHERAGLLSVLFIDIDDFKSINDSRGHSAGDELIVAFAGRLREAVPASCELARVGGDEFVALVPHADFARLQALAQTLLHALAQAVPLRGAAAYLTVSVGVARFPDDGNSGETLLAAAGIATHAAKRAGKNTWRFYDEQLGRDASHQALSLQNLRNAFERGEFTLHYQPKMAIATGERTGYEALLRWRSATGLRGTAALIAAAEQSGFISTLGEWVLRSAARQSREWRDSGFQAPIAINVSALQLIDTRFLDAVRGLVASDPELPQHLVFELTESTLAMEIDRALIALSSLAQKGFAIHIDDFGTGYSNLGRLSRMPVDTLKIDRSFIAGTPHRADACELVKGIVALARALNLNVVAEGVETQAQLEFLRASGCAEAQGYLIGRPLPPEEIVARAAHPDVVPGRRRLA